MSVNNTPRIAIYNYRVILQIEVSLVDDFRGMIYNCKIFMQLVFSVKLTHLSPVQY